MMLSLAERGETSSDFAAQVEMTVEDVLSRQYIRFCPSDAWQPNINIYETADAIIVCADLAGMNADSIQVEFQDGCLVLRGDRPRPLPSERTESTGVHLMEIRAGVFCRQIEIPGPVDHDRISAKYKEGLLWITLPKKP